MLKFIQYQIDDDTEAQQALEKQVSAGIAKNINMNIAAFREHIPSLVDIIDSHQIQQYSLFCTKEQQLNIVDFSTGRAFYGVNPQQDVSEELAQYFKAASYFSLTEADGQSWRRRPLPNSVDVMLVFGMGLGYHLTELISNCRIRFLVVYEPNLDMLMCSVQTHDWSMLLDTARALGTHIFIQAGSDASGITSELAELLQFDANLHDIYVYRHQFHPVMDEVINYLMENSGDLDKLTKAKPLFAGYQHALDYVPEHAPNTAAVYQEKAFHSIEAEERFTHNMQAFQRFYPEIWQNMQQYQPKHWTLVEDDNGTPNLYHRKRQALFYKDCVTESAEVARFFVDHPYKDDVIVGIKNPGKLWKYLHFMVTDHMSQHLEKTILKQSKLPASVNCMIQFGIAFGLQTEILTKDRTIENLFICEPNLDFFYASLFITDWAAMLEKMDQQKSRLYLNLGGDGSTYFYDLMSQFYQVGAYSIANTYLMTSYYSSAMQRAGSDLRAELKVVLAMGEYYDHARYGIAHTYYSVDGHHRFMRKNFPRADFAAYELPVFIVGNGPSLDECYSHLYEHRDKYILVSCGTALKSLHAHGLCPDFHAEIEQNRSTYDWITRIDDREYLKQIRLISVNGMHPETAALFRETLLCFKEGEASTYMFSNGLEKHGIQIASLAFAYPTVTNMVLNYMIRWGFRYFYFWGVDLGFVAADKHHSSHSAYYKNDGSQVYNYQEFHGGGVPVEGNFRPIVYTKPEFDVSRKLLGQAIAASGHRIEVYNCSNGSKIRGAQPLLPENVLLPAEAPVKADLLADLIEQTFHPLFSGLGKKVYEQYPLDVYAASMTQLHGIMDHRCKNQAEAMELIKAQWEHIRSKALVNDDLTFMLMHGSANFVGGLMTKIAANIGPDAADDFVESFNFIRWLYCYYVERARDYYLEDPLGWDTTTVMDLFQ